MIDVHPTAVIHPSARLGRGVRIGPYAVVGEHSAVGDGTVLGPHAVIEPFTTVGQDCQIFSGAVVGGIPQDKKYEGGESYTVIGDRNVIREFVTINRATGVGEETRIGDDNLLMAYVHIAHDCLIGNHVVMANGVTLAGHVVIEDYVTIGGLCGLHQFIHVGASAMIGAMTRLVQDMPPFMLVEGNPPKVHGPNVVGLKRRGLEQDERTRIKRAYKLLYRSGLSVPQAVERIAELGESDYLQHLMAFVSRAGRGLVGKVERAAEPDSAS